MTTKEELQQQIQTATTLRKADQDWLFLEELKLKKERDNREVEFRNKRIKYLRGLIDSLRYQIKNMPKADLQKPKPAIMEKPEFKQKFRDAVGVQQEPAAQIKLDTIEDLDQAWPNIKGKNILVKAPKEVKDELMRRWRKEFNTIKVDGYRPLKMND